MQVEWLTVTVLGTLDSGCRKPEMEGQQPDVEVCLHSGPYVLEPQLTSPAPGIRPLGGLSGPCLL